MTLLEEHVTRAEGHLFAVFDQGRDLFVGEALEQERRAEIGRRDHMVSRY